MAKQKVKSGIIKRFIVKKYVMADSAKEALKKEGGGRA